MARGEIAVQPGGAAALCTNAKKVGEAACGACHRNMPEIKLSRPRHRVKTKTVDGTAQRHNAAKMTRTCRLKSDRLRLRVCPLPVKVELDRAVVGRHREFDVDRRHRPDWKGGRMGQKWICGSLLRLIQQSSLRSTKFQRIGVKMRAVSP